MWRHPSPFPSCFRPSATTDDNHSPPPTTSGNHNLTTCLYHTHLGLFSLTWSHHFLRRSLHLQHHPSLSVHVQITKPFFFSNKRGSKQFAIPPNHNVKIHWDLSKAKFSSRPEPESGFYVSVVVDGEMILLVGDFQKEAYAKTRAKRLERQAQALILRREHVFGNRTRVYNTKAYFGGKTREISIDCSDGDDPRLCFSVDKKRVLLIKRLKWKFRGNERIEVDGVPINVSWDVYNWLFEDETVNGHAVFMFRFEKNRAFEEDDEELKNGMVLWKQQLCGFGIDGLERKKMKKGGFLLKTATGSWSSSSFSSASSGCSSSVMEWASVEEKELSGPTEFSLVVYAWRS